MIAKKVFSQFKALAPPPSILVSYFSSWKFQLPLRFQKPDDNSLVAVWWDFDSCPVPEGVNISRVPQAIKTAVQAYDLNGPIKISAVTDVFKQPKGTLKTLHLANIKILHAPIGVGSDVSALPSLHCWVKQIPSPSHLIVISDRNLDRSLAQFRSRNYRIFRVSRELPAVCPDAVSIVWRWNDLLKGENLSGLRNFIYSFNYKCKVAEPLLPNSSMVDSNSGAENLAPVD